MRPGGWIKHTGIVIGAVLAFMITAAFAAWPWWEYAFLSDDSPVSWLSSALLVANAAVALNLTLSRSFRPGLGYALAAALGVLALDEQFQLHERLKESVDAGRLGNLPTWLVAIGGIAFLIALLRTLTPAAARMIAAAVLVGLFALWMDLGTPSVGVSRLEEAYEVLAESLFLCGLLEFSRAHVQSSA